MQQNLWKAYFQILTIISLKEFIKLNVKTVKRAEFKDKDCECCLEYTNFNDNLIEYIQIQ